MVIDTETNGSLNKKRLLKELASRLGRDKQLRYAEREFEMQRLMMGKGSRQKIVGAEKVEGDDMDVEDEDEIDSRKGKRRAVTRKVDEATYKPRVYKWRLERKRWYALYSWVLDSNKLCTPRECAWSTDVHVMHRNVIEWDKVPMPS